MLELTYLPRNASQSTGSRNWLEVTKSVSCLRTALIIVVDIKTDDVKFLNVP